MAAPRYDVLGIGNAIVDVIARAEDDFLVAQGMHKGAMALIDEARAAAIYAAMGPATESSGGSAANTIVGVASFGARAAFIGKVKDDELGRAFAHDIRAARVAFDAKPAKRRPLDRALLHHGDAGRRAHHEHFSRRRAGSRRPTTSTRRRWRTPPSPISKAICGIRRRRRKPSSRRPTSRTRPDGRSRSRCRIRSASTAIAPNSSRSSSPAPSTSCSPTSTSCTACTRPPISTPASRALQEDATLAVVTRSEKGCVVVSGEGLEAVNAVPVEQVVDVTGAGDLFAAGFLVGLARNQDLRDAARLGGARRVRSDPACRGAAGGVAESAGRGKRPGAFRPQPSVGNRLVTERGYRFVKRISRSGPWPRISRRRRRSGEDSRRRRAESRTPTANAKSELPEVDSPALSPAGDAPESVPEHARCSSCRPPAKPARMARRCALPHPPALLAPDRARRFGGVRRRRRRADRQLCCRAAERADAGRRQPAPAAGHAAVDRASQQGSRRAEGEPGGQPQGGDAARSPRSPTA